MHYPGAYNRANRGRQLSVSGDASVLFHPSGSVVQVGLLLDGAAVGLQRCKQLGRGRRPHWTQPQHGILKVALPCPDRALPAADV